MISLRPSKIAVAGFPAAVEEAFVCMLAGRGEACVRGFAITVAVEELDYADVMVVSPELFISRPDFFLPRRQKTAVMFPVDVSVLQMPVTPLSFSDTTDTIVQRLNKMLPDGGETADNPEGQLTQREIEVLKQIASGKTNKEIADALNISVNTAITHRKNITRKLGIRSASGLSLFALMNGLL